MSDRFQPLTTDQLVDWVFDELEGQGSIFGIPKELFFVPRQGDVFGTSVYEQHLETPFGVAAGPHSQMAQNIIAAWLCGARFMELKTVQTLDELDVSKPCIDMQDEGYNVEWSQELKVDQSFDEYLRAWVLIHALHRHLGLPGPRPGVIFNMSVGYDLEGVQQANVQRFLARMADAGEALEECLASVARRLPEVRDAGVPRRISDNVTVSTMHGCPPGEIGKICRYLMEGHHLHTSVKLNPTLLGAEQVRRIVNEQLGYRDIVVPDEAFEHDISYTDALVLLEELLEVSETARLAFGVKLCNTLEVQNHRDVFAPDQAMMYMSGRAHHALAVGVAARLDNDLDGRLSMSFSGGAEAWNVVPLLAGGMTTVTTCSDLLRPGGYGRMLQYVDAIRREMERLGAEGPRELALRTAAEAGEPADVPRDAARSNLARYAERVASEPRLAKDTFDRRRTKTSRALGPFDCIEAPCVDECPISQRVPEYMALVAAGEPEEAARVIRQDNAMAAILGKACNHACELVCTRTHYDEPLAIREIKRFAMEHEGELDGAAEGPGEGTTVAVVGGGPCGLSVAWFLGRAGYQVTLFEARDYPGGMVSGSIPAYRATSEAIDQDLRLLDHLGVEVRKGQPVGEAVSLEELQGKHDFVVIAAGAQRGYRLGVDGEDADGVHDGLELLRAVREGRGPKISGRVGVIGGGDVAMDCARTAKRLGGEVTIVYRRTRAEMPAQREELEGLLEEGIPIRELLAPVSVLVDDGRMVGLECAVMRLGEPDDSGRRRPEETGEKVELPLEALVVAIGQQPDLAMLRGLELDLADNGYIAVDAETLETSAKGLYAGGDVIEHGPETIVRALGDGKRIAQAIRARVEGGADHEPAPAEVDEEELPALLGERARRARRVAIPTRAPAEREGFEEIVETLSDDEARAEAERCLRCDLLCSVCAGVCPNRAIQTYRTEPFDVELPELHVRGGAVKQGALRPFVLRQRYQVAVLTDFCNECGNCATFCPTSGRPYADKPRIYLRRAEAEAEEDNAFMVFRDTRRWAAEGRFDGERHEVVLDGEVVRYSSPAVEAELRRETLEVIDARPGPEAREGSSPSLEPCATMTALVEGIAASLPHLPTAQRQR